MRLSIPYLVYHPERIPNLTDTYCFSVKDVDVDGFVTALLDDIRPGHEVELPHPQYDCSNQVRRTSRGYQIKRICHGSFTDQWRDATQSEATSWLRPCAEYMISRHVVEGWLYWRQNNAVV